MTKYDLVILAAGKGTRLLPLTENIPKCLVEVNKKPIIFYTLENLPQNINKVIIVVKHLSKEIEKNISTNFPNINVVYAEQLENYTGTYGALYSAKEKIETENFIVLNADDIYSKKDIESMANSVSSMAIFKTYLPDPKYKMAELSENNKIANLRVTNEEEIKEKQYMVCGAYVLDSEFWKLSPVKLYNSEEYGIPNTLKPFIQDLKLDALILDDWTQVNTHEDLSKANSKYC